MKKKRALDEHEFLAIKLTSHEASVGESINAALISSIPRYVNDSDAAVTPDVRLSLSGTCTYPESRAGDHYEFTIYGRRSEREKLTLNDIRLRDKGRNPVYRTYRGHDYPVFERPSGIATLERERGTRAWRCSHFATPDTVARILSLMAFGRELYLSIHERKVERQRWIQGFTVQTTDPAFE